ncbi:hypothetical protein E2C01_011842 [Portunus trituberculatus]|uniref:Uncharacterized protein n=1 Tax=Portunus trituberculatus TaxID=210409 RepID=A0A5B7DCC7_PORTR|nr:hypothetical protein [Portunus trituberculatus]
MKFLLKNSNFLTKSKPCRRRDFPLANVCQPITPSAREQIGSSVQSVTRGASVTGRITRTYRDYRDSHLAWCCGATPHPPISAMH